MEEWDLITILITMRMEWMDQLVVVVLLVDLIPEGRDLMEGAAQTLTEMDGRDRMVEMELMEEMHLLPRKPQTQLF